MSKELSRERKITLIVAMLFATANCFIVVAALLVPYCFNNGAAIIGSFLKFLLSGICHQYQPRCLVIFDLQTCLCARCFAFYAANMVFAIIYAAIRLPNRPISFITLSVLVLPLVIDGTTQLLGFRTSTNAVRVATGLLAGVGTAAAILPFVSLRPSSTNRIFQQGGKTI